MTTPRRIGIFLAALGVVLAAASGVLWQRQTPRAAQIASRRTALEDSIQRVHARYMQESLQLKALNNSYSVMPDTVRRYGAGKLLDASTIHEKRIRMFRMEERDLKIQVAVLERKSEGERAAAKAAAMPVAIAGGAALLVGAVLLIIPTRRVGA
jgi:hypothetical protein